MISAEALAALSGIENGAHYNALHTTARELIAAGYACDNWGQLDLTEAGRIYLRRGKFNIRITGDDHVSDMMSVTHMQIPDAPIDRRPSKFWKNHAVRDLAQPHRSRGDYDPQPDTSGAARKPIELVQEAPAEPLPAATDRMQEMLRAAGVASGITGVWPDEKWVLEFMKALDGVFSEARTEVENTPSASNDD
jgi:hypothetical protein